MLSKEAYFICYNHMDPLWRRCFENHFTWDGHVIRPYSDVEEAQFDQWLTFVRNSDCRYSIEQSLTIKKYLERNPDKLELFKALVREGKLILLGAGETIIDTNMVHGESIVRNHLYSILWYKKHLDRVPDNALATDAFGLSAQLPQILRGFGYTALLKYDYSFLDARPFWSGLNGDLLYIKQSYADAGVRSVSMIEWMKYRACPECQGNGCRLCGYAGLDYSYKNNSKDRSVEELFRQMKEWPEQKFIVSVASEECLKTDDFIEQIDANGRKYDVHVNYTTFNEVADRFGKPYVDALKSNRVQDKDIDPRAEGNPYATGCYATRIELKKLNRRLEDMLLSAEKFAVYASDFDMIYPRKKIERLWNKMAFMQFHDCITGSGVDAGYEELLQTGREIALGASQIRMEAERVIERCIAIPPKPGYQPFVMFNPLNWTVEDHLLEAVLEVDSGTKIDGLTIEDRDGRTFEIVDFQCVQNHGTDSLKIRFRGAALPSVGYKTFYFKPEGNHESPLEVTEPQIENEYYRIRIKDCKIASVFDKELQQEVLSEGAGDLVVEDDWGSPWNTLAPPFFSESVGRPDFFEYVTGRDYQSSVTIEGNGRRKVITLQGSYANRERQVTKLLWKQQITLYQGMKKIFFKTEVDWAAANQRLQVLFPLGFSTQDDEAYYEIPYGTLKRKSYKGQYDFQGAPNGDWPALNFVSCRHPDKDYSVTVFNKGLPCHRVANGTIYMGILRSPGHPAGSMYDFDGARDEGRHSFEYMVTTNKGDLKDGGIVRAGIEFNTEFSNCRGTSKQGQLEPEYSFLANQNENVIVASIKRAEASDHKVIRAYEAYGDEAEDAFAGLEECDIVEVNLLEEPLKASGSIRYGGFDIKTFKVLPNPEG